LQRDRTVGLRERLGEAVDAADPLIAQPNDHVARTQPGIISRRPRKYPLNDNLIRIAVVDDDPVLIQRVVIDNAGRQHLRLQRERLLLAFAKDNELHGLCAQIGAGQILNELRLGPDRLTIDRDDAIAFAKTRIGEYAAIGNIGDDQAVSGPAIEPEAQIGGAGGLNVLPCELAGVASRGAGLRTSRSSLARFLTCFTSFLASFAAGLAGRFAREWSSGPRCAGCRCARSRLTAGTILWQDLAKCEGRQKQGNRSDGRQTNKAVSECHGRLLVCSASGNADIG
jgi:hypothetical protein